MDRALNPISGYVKPATRSVSLLALGYRPPTRWACILEESMGPFKIL